VVGIVWYSRLGVKRRANNSALKEHIVQEPNNKPWTSVNGKNMERKKIEKVVREMKIRRDEGIMLNETCISLLAYADDIVLIGEDKYKVVDLCNRIIEATKKVGLHINPEKTEYMKVSRELENIPLTQ